MQMCKNAKLSLGARSDLAQRGVRNDIVITLLRWLLWNDNL